MEDPVSERLGDDEDLQEVATWEPRSILDRVAVGAHRLLATSKRWVLVVFAALLLAAQFGIVGYAVLLSPLLGVLSLLSILPALALVGGIWYTDRAMAEPVFPMAVTFILAVVFAGIAAAVNSVFAPLAGLAPVIGQVLFFFLVVGPVEETVKWLGIRTYAYRTDAFDAVVDGAVYGAVAGLGFATIENAIYITRRALESGASPADPLAAAGGIALTRAFVGPGHVIYSAFAGYYLGLAKFNDDHAGPLVVKGLLVAALIHGTYNSLATLLPIGGLGFVAFIVAFDGLFGYLLYRKLAAYRDAYERATGGGAGA